MSEKHVKGAAEEVTRGVEQNLTGRAVNEDRLQAEGRGDKLRGDARTAAGSDKDFPEDPRDFAGDKGSSGSAADGFSGSAASKEQDDLNRD